MIVQYDHILQSSFYLWFEYQLAVAGGAYKEKDIQFYAAGQGPLSNLSNSSSYFPDVPEGMISYNSPYRQFLALHDIHGAPPHVVDPDVSLFSPSALPPRYAKHIKINAASFPEFPDAPQGPEQIIIDYKNGRILLDEETYGSSNLADVKGVFNVKTFNTYFTSEDEESLLINSDFLIKNDSLKTFLESKQTAQASKLKDKTFTVPAGFITISKSENKPFEFGGLDQTRSLITVVIVANTNYELDFALSLFRDKAEGNFPIVPFEDFPYGDFFGIKTAHRPYNYAEYIHKYRDRAFIEGVSASKLSDKVSKRFPKDLKVGFIDFDLSGVRMPQRSCEPIPTPSNSLSPSLTPVTPSPSATHSRTSTPTASKTPSQTYGDVFKVCGETLTSTATPSVTRTFTATPSATRTSTRTPTVTSSLSISSTQTYGDVFEVCGSTPSPSLTGTPTLTATRTSTATSSSSISLTQTYGDVFEACGSTPSPSSTGTSPTATSTISPTSTISESATGTATASRTPTRTASPSLTPSASLTPTLTATPSPSVSPTQTYGDVFEACGVTPSPSLSKTLTSTATSSATKTPTSTPSGTATSSASPTCLELSCSQSYVMQVTLGGGPAWGPGWSPVAGTATYDTSKTPAIPTILPIEWLGYNYYTQAVAGTNNTSFVGPETFYKVDSSWNSNGIINGQGIYETLKSESCDELRWNVSTQKYELHTSKCPPTSPSFTSSPSVSATSSTSSTATPSPSVSLTQTYGDVFEACGPTPSPSVSRTLTETSSATRTSTATSSPSPSPSSTQTYGDVFEACGSTPSPSSTGTSTLTTSPSLTQTYGDVFEACEPTPSPSSTGTSTLTTSPSLTGTFTASPSLTGTLTKTFSPSVSLTQTYGDVFEICGATPSPSETVGLSSLISTHYNPSHDGEVNIYSDGSAIVDSDGFLCIKGEYPIATPSFPPPPPSVTSTIPSTPSCQIIISLTLNSSESDYLRGKNSSAGGAGQDVNGKIPLGYGGPFSISLRFKPTANNVTLLTNYSKILLTTPSIWTYDHPYLWINSSNQVQIRSWSGGINLTCTNTIIQLNEINDLVITRTGTTGLKIYLNGTLTDQVTDSYNNPTKYRYIRNFGQGHAARQHDFPALDYFDGQFYYLGVWKNGTISASDVLKIHNNGIEASGLSIPMTNLYMAKDWETSQNAYGAVETRIMDKLNTEWNEASRGYIFYRKARLLVWISAAHSND